jgi:hypothetical protein
MKEISRSVRIIKQAKKIVLTVQSIHYIQMMMWQRPYDDMECPYAEVAVDDVAIDYWQMWANHWWTRGIFLVKWLGATWPSRGLPRGTLLCYLFGCLKYYGFYGDQTPNLLHRLKSLQSLPCQRAILCSLLYI